MKIIFSNRTVLPASKAALAKPRVSRAHSAGEPVKGPPPCQTKYAIIILQVQLKKAVSILHPAARNCRSAVNRPNKQSSQV